jgi:hypothetical protein
MLLLGRVVKLEKINVFFSLIFCALSLSLRILVFLFSPLTVQSQKCFVLINLTVKLRYISVQIKETVKIKVFNLSTVWVIVIEWILETDQVEFGYLSFILIK